MVILFAFLQIFQLNNFFGSFDQKSMFFRMNFFCFYTTDFSSTILLTLQNTQTVPSPQGGFGGLSPANKAPSPPN